MKKIINDPANYVDEMLDGLCAAHRGLSRTGAEGRTVTFGRPNAGRKVGVVSGGGSGHLPLFTGYVGAGLLDACAIGNVFEGPTVGACVDAIKAADRGHGVLCLFGNYGGDRMNFEMAGEMVDLDGIATKIALGTDDIASAPSHQAQKRRGVAGIVYAFKLAGAKADQGAPLDEVAAMAERTIARTRTIGFATSSCQIPGALGSSFALGDDEMEFGMGIHGEPGIWRAKLKSADALVDEMLDRILVEKPADAGREIAVLVNSLGATPYEELYIMYRRLAARLGDAGLVVRQSLIGPYVTSMEMAGASVSLCFLDDEMAQLLDAPAICPFWQTGAA